MTKRQIQDFLVWGIVLWFIGYVLGIIFFMMVPPHLIGWIIMPIGTVLTWWILMKKIKSTSLNYYIVMAVFWTLLAVLLDYLFIVQMLHPSDGYYKPSVIIYYLITLFLPIIIGKSKTRRAKKE